MIYHTVDPPYCLIPGMVMIGLQYCSFYHGMKMGRYSDIHLSCKRPYKIHHSHKAGQGTEIADLIRKSHKDDSYKAKKLNLTN